MGKYQFQPEFQQQLNHQQLHQKKILQSTFLCDTSCKWQVPSAPMLILVVAPQVTSDIKYLQHQELWEQQTLQWQLQELHNPPELNFIKCKF